jgi:hypothetical protein
MTRGAKLTAPCPLSNLFENQNREAQKTRHRLIRSIQGSPNCGREENCP